jgi:hypothetical protein
MNETDEKRPVLRRRNAQRGTTTSVYLGQEIRAKLLEYARQKSASVSSVVEVAVYRYLHEAKKL